MNVINFIISNIEGKKIALASKYYRSYYPEYIVDGIAGNSTIYDSYCNANLNMVSFTVAKR